MIQADETAVAVALAQVGPGLWEDVRMEVDFQNAASRTNTAFNLIQPTAVFRPSPSRSRGAYFPGTAITAPHFLQVRSGSLA